MVLCIQKAMCKFCSVAGSSGYCILLNPKYILIRTWFVWWMFFDEVSISPYFFKIMSNNTTVIYGMAHGNVWMPVPTPPGIKSQLSQLFSVVKAAPQCRNQKKVIFKLNKCHFLKIKKERKLQVVINTKQKMYKCHFFYYYYFQTHVICPFCLFFCVCSMQVLRSSG